MPGWNLAQINIARLVGPEGDPRVQPFFDALDGVNALADRAPGFVWRLQDDSGDATALQPTPDPQLIVNMSVWTDADALFDFVYKSAHTPVMARRRDWMERLPRPYQALWYVELGNVPTVADGLSRLWMLERYGPTPHAFDFKSRFPAPGHAGAPADMKPDPWCMGSA